ncbi:PrgI family protein [Streptococcus suis]|uniref:PrgI family protein n=1 Tax=Streptococcus suis TaxID=1307 RepID=UPI0038BA6FE6
MNKIGSEFLKEFSGYESNFFWKFTLRQTVLLVGVLITAVFGTAIVYYKLPEFLIYILGGILLPPFVIYGLKKEEALFDKVRFFFLITERIYQVEDKNWREYSKNEFVQSKTVSETDSF